MKKEFLLLKRYKHMPVHMKAALWFTICNFLQRGISMITTPVFARLMPTEEYGLFSTFLSWESVLLIIVSLSLYKGIMNLYNKYNDYSKVLSSVCSLELTITFVWLVIGLLFKDSFSEILKIPSSLVVCLFLIFPMQAIFYCWSLFKRYIYDYKSLIIVTLLMTLGIASLGICMVLLIETSAFYRALAQTIIMIIIGICLIVLVYRNSCCFFDRDIWRFSLSFCVPLLPHYLSEFVLQSSDKIMINYMCGTNDVAIYSIAYSAGSLINLITSALNSSFAPYQYQKIKMAEYDKLSKRSNQVLAFVGVMLSLIMIFSREIVLVFGGYKYLESVSVIIPICLGVYFNYMFQLFARVQEYYERKFTVVLPSILCAIFNLISNYVFINVYGYKAAAYTTFFCYLLFCVVHYLFYIKVCKEILDGQQLYDIKRLALISLLVIICGISISFINEVLWLKYLIVFFALIITVFFRKKVIGLIKILFCK